MKPKGYGVQPAPILDETGENWLIRVPVSDHYTINTAARILSSSSASLNKYYKDFQGPKSVEDYPVDHDALVAYARRRDWKYKRMLCRTEVAKRLGAFLKGGATCT